MSLCAGRITHARRLVNGWTNGPFWHVTLETFLGPLDIVAAYVEPTVGHLAFVRAWLVGRPNYIISYDGVRPNAAAAQPTDRCAAGGRAGGAAGS